MLLAILLASVGSGAIRAKIPGQEVEVSIEIPEFQSAKEFLDANRDAKEPRFRRFAAECAYDLTHPNARQLLFGITRDGAIVSVLFEENLPWLAAEECGKRWAEESRYQRFRAGELQACEFRMESKEGGGASTGISHWHAYLATADYLIDLHVSGDGHTSGSGASHEFTRADFLGIAKTLALTGRADVAKLSLPPELYAFRDEAASAGGPDPLGWVAKQCAARKDEWAPAWYRGALADQREKPEVCVDAYARAAELLAALPERTPKQALALVQALDRAASVCASQKKYKDAIPLCERLVELVAASDPPELQKFREEALYHLAGCQAVTGKHSAAIESLRRSIGERPEFRERAAGDPLFAPLRTKPEFKKLVGG